jgi:hypothetical protein
VLDAELIDHPPPAGRAHGHAPFRILQQLDDCMRQCRLVVRWHEQARLVVNNSLR